MIRLGTGDLIAIASGASVYYALIVGKQVLFGGTLCYVFHLRTRTARDPAFFLQQRRQGFFAIVDWIVPNRESRLTRLAKQVDTSLYPAPRLFKHTLSDLFDDEPAGKRKPRAAWSIVDEKFREKKHTRRLTAEEARLPNFECLSARFALKLAGKKWLPEHDAR